MSLTVSCRLGGAVQTLCAAALVVAAGLPFAAQCADGDEPKEEEIRFELFRLEGQTYRLDRKTGEFLKLIRGADGRLIGVRERVQIVETEPKKVQRSGPKGEVPPEENGAAQIQPGIDRETRKKKLGDIEVFGEDGKPIPFQVYDTDRKDSLPAIASYQDRISTIQALDIGERITGNILVKNLGEKKLKALELTLSIPVVGLEKPDEHRFLFADKPGFPPPPQPGTGKDILALLQKVDLPSPPGGVKGALVLRVSYIKFAE